MSNKTNLYLDRAASLLRLMTDKPDAQWQALADGVTWLLHLAFEAMIAELANNYGLSGRDLGALEQYNADMAELQRIKNLLNDDQSWLARLEHRFQTYAPDYQPTVGLIGSSKSHVEPDKNFYLNCHQQLSELAEQFRQDSQFW